MVGTWNPVITQGGGWDRTLTFTQDGGVYSLAGATATMSMTPPDGTTTTLSTANGKITIDGAAGTVTLKLTVTEVDAIDWAQGVVQSRLVITQSGTYAEAIELIGTASLV